MKINWKIILIIAVIIGLSFILFLGKSLEQEILFKTQSHYQEILHQVQQEPITYSSLYFVIYLLVSAFALPGAALLTLVAGAVFGLIKATFLTLIAATLGASLAFLLTRNIFREQLISKYGDKLGKINQNLEKMGASYLFFLRLNPIFPFFMVNSLMGLSPMKLGPFFRISLIGMLPGTLLYANAGSKLQEISNLADLLSPQIIGSFFILGLFPLAAQWIYQRFTQQNQP